MRVPLVCGAAITAPCLLYCGEGDPYHDGAKECVTHMPNARLLSLAGLNHGSVRIDVVLPHAKAFLAQVART